MLRSTHKLTEHPARLTVGLRVTGCHNSRSWARWYSCKPPRRSRRRTAWGTKARRDRRRRTLSRARPARAAEDTLGQSVGHACVRWLVGRSVGGPPTQLLRRPLPRPSDHRHAAGSHAKGSVFPPRRGCERRLRTASVTKPMRWPYCLPVRQPSWPVPIRSLDRPVGRGRPRTTPRPIGSLESSVTSSLTGGADGDD